MRNPDAFFASVRQNIHKLGLNQSQVDGINRLVAAFEKAHWPVYYAAYGLATSLRECGGKYEPVREGFKKTDAEAREYVKRNYPTKYGKPTIYGGQFAYGRGDVQLTWAPPNKGNIDNYGKADKKLAELGLIKPGELTKDFDKALRPDLSAVIMIYGMQEGWFTGKKLSDYLDKDVPDFYNARRVVNGTDAAQEIADNARKFLYALQSGGYGVLEKPQEIYPAPPPPDVPKPVPLPKPELTFFQWLASFFRS